MVTNLNKPAYPPQRHPGGANPELVRICVRVHRRPYKRFKQACIELNTTVSAEISNAIQERLSLWQMAGVERS